MNFKAFLRKIYSPFNFLLSIFKYFFTIIFNLLLSIFTNADISEYGAYDKIIVLKYHRYGFKLDETNLVYGFEIKELNRKSYIEPLNEDSKYVFIDLFGVKSFNLEYRYISNNFISPYPLHIFELLFDQSFIDSVFPTSKREFIKIKEIIR